MHNPEPSPKYTGNVYVCPEKDMGAYVHRRTVPNRPKLRAVEMAITGTTGSVGGTACGGARSRREDA